MVAASYYVSEGEELSEARRGELLGQAKKLAAETLTQVFGRPPERVVFTVDGVEFREP